MQEDLNIYQIQEIIEQEKLNASDIKTENNAKSNIRKLPKSRIYLKKRLTR